MDEKIKPWPLRFPTKETLIWRRHCSTGQSCCSMTSKRSIGWFLVIGHKVFSPERSLNQPKAKRVCIRSINQSNRSISVRLLFLFCSGVFISRSYENHSKNFEQLIILSYNEDVFKLPWARAEFPGCNEWHFLQSILFFADGVQYHWRLVQYHWRLRRRKTAFLTSLEVR